MRTNLKEHTYCISTGNCIFALKAAYNIRRGGEVPSLSGNYFVIPVSTLYNLQLAKSIYQTT
jgi:hypothetical protein